MDGKIADQSIENGEAESTAAPMAVAPIKTNLRIVILPTNAVTTALSFSIIRTLMEIKRTCFAECVRSAVLSAVLRFGVSQPTIPT
jgi:hypothetical protein